MDITQADAWIQQFSATWRGAIGDAFYRAARAGCHEPEAMLLIVKETYQARLLGTDGERRTVYEHALTALMEDQTGAIAFAESVLRREALPEDERRRLKSEARQRGIAAVLAEREGRR